MKIHLNRAGQSLGQFSAEEVRAGYRDGRFNASDLAWCDGMPMWKQLGEVIDEIAPAVEVSVDVQAAPPPAGETPSLPWEKRAELGFFPAILQTVVGVLLEPTKTFRSLPTTGGVGAPLLFYALCLTVATLAGLAYQLLLESYVPGAVSEEGSISEFFVSSLAVGLVFIFLPLIVVAVAFVGAGITHLALMIVGGAKKPFEATFRVFCYAGGATGILQLIPACGALIGGIWNIVVMTVGLSEAHGISKGRALFAVLFPLVVSCVLVGAVVIVGLMSLVPGAVQN